MARATFGSEMTPWGVICELVMTGFTESFAEMTPLGTIGDSAGDRNLPPFVGASLVSCFLGIFPADTVHLDATSIRATGSALGSRDDALAEAEASSEAERTASVTGSRMEGSLLMRVFLPR